jgi:hypothetical protein
MTKNINKIAGVVIANDFVVRNPQAASGAARLIALNSACSDGHTNCAMGSM